MSENIQSGGTWVIGPATKNGMEAYTINPATGEPPTLGDEWKQIQFQPAQEKQLSDIAGGGRAEQSLWEFTKIIVVATQSLKVLNSVLANASVTSTQFVSNLMQFSRPEQIMAQSLAPLGGLAHVIAGAGFPGISSFAGMMEENTRQALQFPAMEKIAQLHQEGMVGLFQSNYNQRTILAQQAILSQIGVPALRKQYEAEMYGVRAQHAPYEAWKENLINAGAQLDERQMIVNVALEQRDKHFESADDFEREISEYKPSIREALRLAYIDKHNIVFDGLQRQQNILALEGARNRAKEEFRGLYVQEPMWKIDEQTERMQEQQARENYRQNLIKQFFSGGTTQTGAYGSVAGAGASGVVIFPGAQTEGMKEQINYLKEIANNTALLKQGAQYEQGIRIGRKKW